jgi:hypothetical protein
MRDPSGRSNDAGSSGHRVTLAVHRLALAASLLVMPVHSAGIAFKPLRAGEHWPRVELRRDVKDPAAPRTAHVFLRQVTNPGRTFGPYLAEKDVALVDFPARAGAKTLALDGVLHVPSSALVAGRYELRVRADDVPGQPVVEAVALLDEAHIARVVAAASATSRGGPTASAAFEGDDDAPSPSADPKLARLDARELAALPSDEARKAAQVFAYVLATRDSEAFRQLVVERGLKTDSGTVPHRELEKQLAKGIDPFVGPLPRAAWHVQYSKESPDRFRMKPSANAAEQVGFQKGADGRWRIEQVARKKAARDE